MISAPIAAPDPELDDSPGLNLALMDINHAGPGNALSGERSSEGAKEMDPHFWPSMYPGMIVGILYGLSLRGVFNTIIAALGGLIGAAIAYGILTAANMNDGLPSVIGLTLAAFIGAYILTGAVRRFSGATTKS